jgi:HK97 gp10 family phage protein
MGGLVQGISTQFEDGGASALVGSRAAAFYGRLLELGTSKIAPRPWLLPAFNRIQDFITRRLEEAADAAISKGSR